MAKQVVVSTETLDKFAQLARLLARASKLAHEISQRQARTFTPVISKLKRPKRIPKDQEWFWTEEWQKKEREVDEALARGEYEEFETVEELLKALHAHV